MRAFARAYIRDVIFGPFKNLVHEKPGSKKTN